MRLSKMDSVPSRFLVLRFGKTPEQCQWIRLENGQPLASGSGFPSPSGLPLRVLVPGSDVSEFVVSVPARSVRALNQAIPFALEDQVAVEIEQLHFVPVMPTRAEGLPVLVVSHARMQTWLGWLSEAGLQAESLVPETQLLPRETGCWHLWLSGQQAWLSPDQGVARMLDRDNLALMLEALLSSIEPEQRPQRLLVTCFDEGMAVIPDAKDEQQASLESALVPILGEITIHWESAGEDQLTRLVTASKSWPKKANLLTGPYDNRAKVSAFLRPWRGVAILAGLFVLLQFIELGLDWSRLNEQQNALETQIVAAYQEAFPNSQPLDPKRQMASALANLGQAGSADVDQFGQILAAAGLQLMAEAGLSINALRYRAGQLDLDLRLASLQSLERLRERLAEKTGWSVEIRSANRDEAGVDARLSLREAES